MNLSDSQAICEADVVTIANALKGKGYIVLPGAFTKELLRHLVQRVMHIPPGQWKQAGMGRDRGREGVREHGRVSDQGIRSDKTRWINNTHPVEKAYLACMEGLRTELNRLLFMGLFGFEGHFAVYEKGAFYLKHLDAFKAQKNRVLSTVLFLNPEWYRLDAGELVLYASEGEDPIERILPLLGTLVIFLSEIFPHEVLQSSRTRYSLTGWFHIRPTLSF